VGGIDIVRDHDKRIKHIEDNFDWFNFILGDSIKEAREIYDFYEMPIDILFIDTVHTYENTMKEFRAWKPYLSKNAVVCLDDLFRPGMDEAWKELPGNKLRLDFLHDGQYPEGGGFGILY